MHVTEHAMGAAGVLQPATSPRPAPVTRQVSSIIVIPAHNEERNIAGVIHDLRKYAPNSDRVVVNDGSRDATARILSDLGERQLRLPCNLGYGRALQLGLRYAVERRYDVVVTFDADGQHRAADVPRLLAALHDRDADVVIGSRFAGGRPYVGPLGRRIGQRLFSQLTGLLIGQRIYDTTSGLKVMSWDACRAVVDSVSQDFHTETIVALTVGGYRIIEEPIPPIARVNGQSMHTLVSSVTYPLQTCLVTLVALIEGRLRRTK